MLAIEVELLGDRYVAGEHGNRARAEWPPHPARFYSALVAALHDRSPVDAEERAALLWLEELPAPSLSVDLSVTEEVGRREVKPVFVPTNDVTLVGDAEADLREARRVFESLGVAASESKRGALSKQAKALKKEEEKFARFMEKAMEPDRAPASSAIKTAMALCPDGRPRNERRFPTVVPEERTFAFLWPIADASAHLPALSRLCGRVTRLGHSTSLVRCAVVDRELKANLVPSPAGDLVLRTAGKGQLARLEAAHAGHKDVEPRVLPSAATRYGAPDGPHPETPRSTFADEWIVFERTAGARPLLTTAADFARALRRALIEIHGMKDLPVSLSGHDANGAATEPHVAFIACPFVGHPHADGSIQGVAIVPPRSLRSDDRELLSKLIGSWERERGDPRRDYELRLGAGASRRWGEAEMAVTRVLMSEKRSLQSRTWCRPSRRFVTVTPIALDRHPGNLRSNSGRTAHRAAEEAEAAIADACVRIGLPRPEGVSISLAPLVTGARHVRECAVWPPTPGRVRRARVHADIRFPVKVRGPVLVGAARYFGLGLCLPVDAGGGA
ncbi:MAG TPA: type I-U CRISPR-associated protein Csb2 [Planctomycetota bacterium]|nr:type I-U CRISPR-associated protein Csb2 [Planctomycetota bacterium]